MFCRVVCFSAGSVVLGAYVRLAARLYMVGTVN